MDRTTGLRLYDEGQPRVSVYRSRVPPWEVERNGQVDEGRIDGTVPESLESWQTDWTRPPSVPTVRGSKTQPADQSYISIQPSLCTTTTCSQNSNSIRPVVVSGLPKRANIRSIASGSTASYSR